MRRTAGLGSGVKVNGVGFFLLQVIKDLLAGAGGADPDPGDVQGAWPNAVSVSPNSFLSVFPGSSLR